MKTYLANIRLAVDSEFVFASLGESKYFTNLEIVENSLYVLYGESRTAFPFLLSRACIAKSIVSRPRCSLIYWINIDFSFDLQISLPAERITLSLPLPHWNSRYGNTFNEFSVTIQKVSHLFYK